mgnify:FL=1
MSSLYLKEFFHTLTSQALDELGLPDDTFRIERCKSLELGDYSTNAPLATAKAAGKPPLELAEAIKSAIEPDESICTDITVSAPGFVNFSISPAYLQNQIPGILSAGDTYGRTDRGSGQRALVEFVSANPTGPLTVGHGRQAVLGDTVSSILKWHGYEVTREYYYNDAGRQMRLLGESVYTRYMEILGKEAELPEDGYEGEYIRDIAQEIFSDHNDSLKDDGENLIFKEKAEETIFAHIRKTLGNVGIEMDSYVNEKTFYDDGSIDSVVADLREQGLAYDADGAVWFKTTKLGKDQDTVLIKSSGEPTYRLPDIAYHCQKVKRGFDLIVDIFGTDHQATYPDVLAGVEKLGNKIDHIRVLIHQFVTLKSAGEKVKMSTRKAEYVTLQELIESVGVDVVRYFFIMRGMQSHLNFDLELATKESEENPVYYLQYAHARICNIIKFGKEAGVISDHKLDLSLLVELSELRLIKEIIRFPEVAQSALEILEPQIIANYLQEVATSFHKFYTECRVITNDAELTTARLALVSATRVVLANGLTILGISRPERM